MSTAPKKRGRPPKAAPVINKETAPTFEESEAAQGISQIRARDTEPEEEIESGFDGPIICPIPTDPAAGDKTPAVVAWWKENHPAEYSRRYGNRVHPKEGEAFARVPDASREDPAIEDDEAERKIVVHTN